jgi:V/A-type H+-transporting ATPase subunit E
MADELQALLNKIDEEGLKKTEAKRASLLSEARKEADAIIEEGRQQAAKIVSEARREAQLLEQNSEQALRQAARNVLLSLRAELEKRVGQAAENLLHDSLSAKDLAGIIGNLCNSYLTGQGDQADLEVLLNAEQFAELDSLLKASLAADLQKHCNFAPGKNLSGGFKLVFKGQDVLYDFSDKALAEAITAHLSPKIAGILTEDF